jgi:hypothetical protein
MGRSAKSGAQVANAPLLDQYPDAYAAYSLRKLRSDYSGPAIHVRRSSDGAKQDFGFAADGKLDTAALENWLSGADGYVATWYSQVQGEPDLLQTDPTRQPRIAEGGTVFTDSDGRVAIKFDRPRNTYLTLESDLSQTVPIHESLVYGVGESGVTDETNARTGIIVLASPGGGGHETLSLRGRSWPGHKWRSGVFSGVNHVNGPGQPAFWAANHAASEHTVYSKNSIESSKDINDTQSLWGLTLGVQTKNTDNGYDGYLTEVAILPGQPTESGVQAVYNNVNADWDLGPQNYNPGALMPQKKAWQVTLYDWLETNSVQDVTLPDGSITYDNSYANADELADLWLQVEGLTASSVTRRSPEWYVLDSGNGKGIEGTGVVRANHNPMGGGYGGNPPRSWQNEPAFLYQLDIPLSGGGQGNDFYQNPALGRRAMVVSIVDLIMHQGLDEADSFNWFDMKGKAFLGMAEAYRFAGDVLPADVRTAYEQGMEQVIEDLTARGPRAVNTNMDMRALHGAADLYAATDNSTLKYKCVQLVKRALFGYTDGELGTKHKVFAAGDRDGGVFDPSGFIMEGGQPDVFYSGDSIYHLMGALQAVTDRSTGNVPSDWLFLEEVVHRLQRWRTYQMFYDPAQKGPEVENRAATVITAGGGFNGRTSYGVPHGQADEPWKHLGVADYFPNHAFRAEGELPSVGGMEEAISSKLSFMTNKMSSPYTAQDPKKWEGWSPWTKRTPYLPPEGWYSDLDGLRSEDDPKFENPPAARSGTSWNETFGGYPTGKEYWSYKQKDANGESFGFFVEAQARQGGYSGWYGGKIETFWTESTGVVLVNRHGKTGCDRSGVDDYSGNEDSVCWFNLDSKAGHHVWGRDENGNGFTTLLLRGRNLNRTSTFNTDGQTPTVTVENIFNDSSLPSGSSKSGEQTGSEIEGDFTVENTFAARSDGLKVTHTLTSNQSDQINQLWASLPVHLRHWNPHRAGGERQGGLEDTSIEYWDGSGWQAMPEDQDGDEVPELVTTTALRLGRDFEMLGQGIQYAYVNLSTEQDVRLAKHKYYDPYQSMTGVRTVHIDLHGNPGTTKTLPTEKSVSYTIETTDPTSEGDTSTSHEIFLQKGWNIVSTSVSPTPPAMDSVFAGLQSEVTVVGNETGERYRPGENINEIGRWNSEEAYRIYAESDVTLTIQGNSIGSPSIALERGWNLVPYFPSSSLFVEEAVSSIAEDLIFVKDESGRVYLPYKGIKLLEQMEPGEGYTVYVRQSTTLTYPGDSN